jgi:hypothetical protein
MGSIHEISNFEGTDTYTWPDDRTAYYTQTTTLQSDPTNPTVNYYTSSLSSGTETITDKWSGHTTTLFYGLEWHATENLWFYINGMFEPLRDGTEPEDIPWSTNYGRTISDVDFFRNLSISAKILL